MQQTAFAITGSGEVYGWGYNSYGNVGSDSSASTVGIPELVKGIGNVGYLEDIVQISCNYRAVIALNANGDVAAWGYNNAGQFGIGTSGNQSPYPIAAFNSEIEYADYGNDFENAQRIYVGISVNGEISGSETDCFVLAPRGTGVYSLTQTGGADITVYEGTQTLSPMDGGYYYLEKDVDYHIAVTSQTPCTYSFIFNLTNRPPELSAPVLSADPIIYNAITLIWGAAAGTNLPVTYDVYRQVENGISVCIEQGLTQTQLTVPAVMGTTYTFKIVATDGTQTTESNSLVVTAPVPAVTSVAELEDITVLRGTAVSAIPLPTAVGVTLSGGAPPTDLAIDWNTTELSAATAGTYQVTGALTLTGGITNPDSLTAAVNIIVVPYITAIAAPADITVFCGTEISEISFPGSVAVALDDNSSTTLTVLWNTSNLSTSSPGQFQVTGTLADTIANPDELVPTVNVIVVPLNIISITAPADIIVARGIAVSEIPFPETVEVTLSNNTTAELTVNWSTNNLSTATAGTFQITGTVTLESTMTNTSLLAAAVNVIVEDILYVLSVPAIAAVSVPHGTSAAGLSLPYILTATLSDNTEKTVGVYWDTANYDGYSSGTYTLTGTLNMLGSVVNSLDITASVDVTVEDAPLSELPDIEYDTIIDGDVTISSALTYTGQKVCYTGNVTVAANVNLNNSIMTVMGTLSVESGYIRINAGSSVYVGRDLRIQKKGAVGANSDNDNDGWGQSTGYIRVYGDTLLCVYGNFYTQTISSENFGQSGNEESIFELKGNFRQIGTDTIFKHSGSTNMYILFSGTREQHISFERTDSPNARLGSVKVINSTGIYVDTPLYDLFPASDVTITGNVEISDKLSLNGNTLNLKNSLKVNGATTLAGGFLSCEGSANIDGTMNLGGGEAVFASNVTFSKSVTLSEGRLICNKNLTFEGSGKITNTTAYDTDVVVVKGDLYYTSTTTMQMNKGVLELQGDIIIATSSTFRTLEDCMVQLSGEGEQVFDISSAGTVSLPNLFVNKAMTEYKVIKYAQDAVNPVSFENVLKTCYNCSCTKTGCVHHNGECSMCSTCSDCAKRKFWSTITVGCISTLPTVQVNGRTGEVTVSGRVNSSSTQASLTVTNSAGETVYVGASDVTNGGFIFNFTLNLSDEGTYRATVTANDMTGALAVSFRFAAMPQALRQTAGIEYEQEYDYTLEELTPPKIADVEIEVLNFVKGIYRLTISNDYSIDTRGSEFFFWKAQNGIFTEASPDFRSVVFAADLGTGCENIRVVVGLGDSLGQTVYKEILLKGNDE